MRPLLPLLLAPVFLTAAYGDVTLPSMISENMVLQRSKAVVYGKAGPGEKVKVSLGESSASTVTGKDGKWRLKLDGLKPGLAGTMTIVAKNRLAVPNVMVGDVWLCAGQSNMAFPVFGVNKAEDEIAMADSPEIRMFTVNRKSSDTPLDEVEGQWQVCDPTTVGRWSAVGYFFARQLHDDLDIPVGMINASWPGTAGQSWTPRAMLESDPELKFYCDQWQTWMADYPAAKEAFDKAIAEWQVVADSTKATGKPPLRPPAPPFAPGSHRSPGAVFNAMVHPLAVWPIKGVIWYQGEANVRDAARYGRLFPAMIGSWRKEWGVMDLPFLFVQIPAFMPRRDLPSDSIWAELREAQGSALNTPNTAMATTVDIGDAARFHPKNKQEVGRRLAVSAEARVYGKDITGSGPLFDSAKFAGDRVIISFKPGTARGLLSKDRESIKGFAVAAEDRKFVWATAEIIGGDPVDRTGTLSLPVKKGKPGKTAKKETPKPTSEQTVAVYSLAVPKPVAVRYAWADNPEVNLVNRAGLPAAPFRTDTWEQEPPPPISPSPTPAPAATPTPAPAATPTPAPAATPTPAPAATPTPAARPTPTATSTPAPVANPSPTRRHRHSQPGL